MLGLYLPGCSALHRCPAGAKMAALVIIGTVLVLLQDLVALSVCLATSIGLFAIAGVRLQSLAPLVRPALVLLLLLFGVHVLLGDWRLGLETLLRLLTLLLLATLVTVTTRLSDMLDALEQGLAPLARFGVNPAKVGMVLSLTIRLIPLLMAHYHDIQEAQRARGLSRNAIAVLVPLMIRTLQMADTLTEAMDARGFDQR